MKRLLVLGILLGICFGFQWAAADDDSAGSIKSVEGNAVVVRDGAESKVTPGFRIYRQDTLKTGGDGALGVMFRDNSTLSLGPSSTIVIDEFLFSPADGKLGMVSRMLNGTAVFLSGEIAKLAPDSVKVETPLATIGIRGTRFMVQVDK